MLKKALSVALIASLYITCGAEAKKRTDCPKDNKLPVTEGKVCCCHTAEGEDASYFECNVVSECDTSEGSGYTKLSGPPFCPCQFTKSAE